MVWSDATAARRPAPERSAADPSSTWTRLHHDPNDGSRVPRTPRKTHRSPYRTPTAVRQLRCSGWSSGPATVGANLGESFRSGVAADADVGRRWDGTGVVLGVAEPHLLLQGLRRGHEILAVEGSAQA